jgi:hypothetical protein
VVQQSGRQRMAGGEERVPASVEGVGDRGVADAQEREVPQPVFEHVAGPVDRLRGHAVGQVGVRQRAGQDREVGQHERAVPRVEPP